MGIIKVKVTQLCVAHKSNAYTLFRKEILVTENHERLLRYLLFNKTLCVYS